MLRDKSMLRTPSTRPRVEGTFPLVPWSRRELTQMRSEWVYVIRDRAGEVVYVGVTKNLRSRIKVHSRLTDDRGYGSWSAEAWPTRAEAEAEEVRLTRRHRPKHNIFVGPTHLGERL